MQNFSVQRITGETTVVFVKQITKKFSIQETGTLVRFANSTPDFRNCIQIKMDRSTNTAVLINMENIQSL